MNEPKNIEVRGARVHNLKNGGVRIRKIVSCPGRSLRGRIAKIPGIPFNLYEETDDAGFPGGCG